ncbi:MAG: V-type ATP synthase subunit D [Spirochaetota bacterium]
MAIKFQYNKTYLQQLNKELKVRLNALPTLQAKESALRLEVKRAKDEMAAFDAALADRRSFLAAEMRLWREFPSDLVRVKAVHLKERKIAGIRTPDLESVEFESRPLSFFTEHGWIPEGLKVLEELATLMVRREIAEKRMAVLEYNRKKTTQKVNLYEKVQIPDYQEAILKIKRFMEDEDNLSKASQKILKARIAAAEEAGAGATA